MCLICEKTIDYDEIRVLAITCSKISTIPLMSKLTSLVCQTPRLKYIPTLPSLQRLKLVNCFGTEIEFQPQLSSLEFIDSIPIFPQISYLPMLLKLQLGFCHLTNQIPNYQRLLKISCDYVSGITSIGGIRSLRHLTCASCDVKYVGNMPGLMTLTLNSCHNLISINDVENVDLIDCDNCQNLENISPCNVSTLICSYCTSLTEIIEFPNLQVLRCQYCPNIDTISLNNAIDISCNDCYSLEEIYSPSTISLNCERCYNLEWVEVREDAYILSKMCFNLAGSEDFNLKLIYSFVLLSRAVRRFLEKKKNKIKNILYIYLYTDLINHIYSFID